MIELIIFAVVFVLVLWLVSIIPLPPTPGAFPLRTVLYILVILVAIVLLLRYVR